MFEKEIIILNVGILALVSLPIIFFVIITFVGVVFLGGPGMDISESLLVAYVGVILCGIKTFYNSTFIIGTSLCGYFIVAHFVQAYL